MKTITYIVKVIKTFGFLGEIHNQGLADLWSEHQTYILDNDQFREHNKRILDGAQEASNSLKPARDRWMNECEKVNGKLPLLEFDLSKISHISAEDELKQKMDLEKYKMEDCCTALSTPQTDLPWLESSGPDRIGLAVNENVPTKKKKSAKKQAVSKKKTVKKGKTK